MDKGLVLLVNSVTRHDRIVFMSKFIFPIKIKEPN